MHSTRGRPRKVTDALIAELLAWKRERRTLKQVARELGITPGLASNALQNAGKYHQPSPERRDAFPVVKGRPRQVTDAQLQRLLEWRKSTKTLVQKARELGITTRQANRAIKMAGKYKQPSPELREQNLGQRHQVMKHLRQAGWR
jgi:transposase